MSTEQLSTMSDDERAAWIAQEQQRIGPDLQISLTRVSGLHAVQCDISPISGLRGTMLQEKAPQSASELARILAALSPEHVRAFEELARLLGNP